MAACIDALHRNIEVFIDSLGRGDAHPAVPARLCSVAGNHDEALSHDGSRLAARGSRLAARLQRVVIFSMPTGRINGSRAAWEAVRGAA